MILGPSTSPPTTLLLLRYDPLQMFVHYLSNDTCHEHPHEGRQEMGLKLSTAFPLL